MVCSSNSNEGSTRSVKADLSTFCNSNYGLKFSKSFTMLHLRLPSNETCSSDPPPPPIQLYRYGLVLGLRLIKFVFQLSSILKFALILTVTNWITRKTWNQWLKCMGHTQLKLHVVFCCVVFKDTWSSWPSNTAPSSPIVLYPRSNPMMNVLLLNVLYNISASYI